MSASGDFDTAAQAPRPGGLGMRAKIAANYLLQLLGDPRYWPRDLPLKKKRLLWRAIDDGGAGEHWPPGNASARLRGLAEAQLQEAKFWYLLVTYVYVLAAGLATAAYVRHEGIGSTEYLPMAAIVLQVVAVVTRLRAFRLHSLGHQADWRALIMDALGSSPNDCDDAIMLENLLTDSARARAVCMSNYYDNHVDEGYGRLALNLRETTFFTGTLYRSSANRVVWIAFLVIALPFLLPLYKVIQEQAVPPAFVVVTIAAVLPLWDVISRIRTWRSSARVLEGTTAALKGVDTPEVILPLLADGVIATATAPLIPRTIYAKWRDEQRERWVTMGEAGQQPD